MSKIPSRSFATALWACALALCLILAIPALSQEAANSTASQDSINKQLLERIGQLENEVKQLRDKQAAPMPAPEPPPVVETRPVHVVADRLRFNVFGDVGYKATGRKGVPNTFEVGSLDLFMTSRLSDSVSTLAEILFTPQVNNSIVPDVERLLIKYRRSDNFTVGFGRYHTSIGYYNTAYNQGAWFETTIGRPFMYAYDEESGFLPMQEVGVTANGKIPSGRLGLDYVAEIGNGRQHLLGADPAQNRQSYHNGKSYNLAVNSSPAAIPGLNVGFSFYRDYLTFPDLGNHAERISALHVVYMNSSYESLNEVMLLTNTNIGLPSSNSVGFYSQFSRKFGAYRPYFRYAYMNLSPSDQIYSDPTEGDVVTRRNGPSIGLRYDFTEHTAFKLQYDRVALRGQPSSNGVGTQFAFTF
jgi:hypothetical protein